MWWVSWKDAYFLFVVKAREIKYTNSLCCDFASNIYIIMNNDHYRNREFWHLTSPFANLSSFSLQFGIIGFLSQISVELKSLCRSLLKQKQISAHLNSTACSFLLKLAFFILEENNHFKNLHLFFILFKSWQNLLSLVSFKN